MHAGHIFCVLIAQLAFDPEPQRRAVGYGQGLSVQLMRQYGLRLKAIQQIDAFIIGPSSQTVSTMKNQKPRAGVQLRNIEQDFQRHASPRSIPRHNHDG